MDIVKLATDNDGPPWSALDGITLMAIDTDPEDNLAAAKVSQPLNGLELLAAIPHKFGGARDGYVLVLYDKSKDRRLQAGLKEQG